MNEFQEHIDEIKKVLLETFEKDRRLDLEDPLPGHEVDWDDSVHYRILATFRGKFYELFADLNSNETNTCLTLVNYDFERMDGVAFVAWPVVVEWPSCLPIHKESTSC